jgi:teichuronic acid biosynthesis glycosyltransferase TuaG
LLNNPIISIITPAYNAASFIDETICSVIHQTYTDWEMIIVNDGSTDSTAEVVQSLVNTDSRIRYIHQANGKQGKARNTAIAAAVGQYLAFLDADDVWHPTKLELQVKAIESGLGDVVFCDGWWLKDTDHPEANPVNTPKGRQDADAFYQKQLRGYSIPMLSAIVKKDAVLDAGGFDEDLRVQNAEDYQLWLRLSDAGYTFFGLQDKLFYYRVHSGQSTYDDGMAIIPALWAMKRANLKRISEQTKREIIGSRLNRYWLHNMEVLPPAKMTDLLQCYRTILNRPWKSLTLRAFYTLGPEVLRKVGYRFLNLNEYVTNYKKS